MVDEESMEKVPVLSLGPREGRVGTWALRSSRKRAGDVAPCFEKCQSLGPAGAEQGRAHSVYPWKGWSLRAWGLWGYSLASTVSPGALDPTRPLGSRSGAVPQLQSGPGTLLHSAGWRDALPAGPVVPPRPTVPWLHCW